MKSDKMLIIAALLTNYFHHTSRLNCWLSMLIIFCIGK